MNTLYIKKLTVCTLSLLVLLGGVGINAGRVRAMENLEDTPLEENEVLIQGKGSHHYVINKQALCYSKNDFDYNVSIRVKKGVKIWDVENEIKNDINKDKEHRIKKYENYHLITNEERNDLAEAARDRGISLGQYFRNSGVDLNEDANYMTSAADGANRIWHYSDPIHGTKRKLFFEKFNLQTNSAENTLIGEIFCPSEDADRFDLVNKQSGRSKNWSYLFAFDDHIKEFQDKDYFLFFVKN